MCCVENDDKNSDVCYKCGNVPNGFEKMREFVFLRVFL